ncbi:hypothetical protein [Bizionia arctica]|uniref:Uncharacterized protein n=1 Tax=Bizionia arctica TaxID=1495645 RepID=A0A917GKZ3_9FLAO|nr:hypothetical protein [Bizionia arctica]GGG49329.1 hypothetical protein GCM10010976_20780 [Bizionia arctica]
MKKFLILLILLGTSSMISAQETAKNADKVIHATYDGYDGDGFYFINQKDNQKMLFVRISPPVLKKFDLMDDTSIGKLFEVSYDLEKVGNSEQPVIINLEKIYETDSNDD